MGPPDPRPGFPTPHRACPPAYPTNSLNAPQLNLPFLLTPPPTPAPHPTASLCPPYSPGYAVAPRPEFSLSSTSLPHFLSPASQMPALSTQHSQVLPILPSIFFLIESISLLSLLKLPQVKPSAPLPLQLPLQQIAIGLPTGNSVCYPYLRCDHNLF